MTSMIERVANVISLQLRLAGLVHAHTHADQFGQKIARAAIEAMMDPTEEMKVAGAENLFGAAHDDWRIDATAVWQAMISAALKENGE